MTSRELAAMMKESPADCHRALVREYGRYVYAIVYNKLRGCGTKEDIEECVSDVFAALFMKCQFDLSSENDIKSLIGTIAQRKAIDMFRRLSKKADTTVSSDDEGFLELPSSENIIESSEVSERNQILLNKIKELGEPDTTIIIKQYYYNMTVAEIGKAISMTAAAVQKRSIRAREKLKKCFAK